MKEKIVELLALSFVPGLGTTRLHQLLNRVGSARQILGLDQSRMKALGFSPEMRAFISSGCAQREAQLTLEAAAKRGVGILTLFDKAYPRRLKEIYDSPLVLFYLGAIEVLSKPSIAIVGSRRASIYGREVAAKLARDLVSYGLVVVSGMARGIDSSAHRGALEGKGATVAVLGTGIDIVYPRENKKLSEQIQAHGCIVSEFPMGCYPAPQNFPIRNRIISGLSFGTLIPEAAEFSGSLITARLTLEQDRELWAVPGNITNPGSYGPNHLIKQGARPIICAEDVLDELPIEVLNALRKRPPAELEKERAEVCGSEEMSFLSMLPFDKAVHFDKLVEVSKMGAGKLSSLLLTLELEGLIRQVPGGGYCRRL